MGLFFFLCFLVLLLQTFNIRLPPLLNGTSSPTEVGRWLFDDSFSTLDPQMFSFFNYSTEEEALPIINWTPLLQKEPSSNPVIYDCGGKSLVGGPLIFGPGANISVIKVTFPIALPFASHWAWRIDLKKYVFSPDSQQYLLYCLYSQYFGAFIGEDSISSDCARCGNTDALSVSFYKIFEQFPNKTFSIISKNHTPSGTSFGYFGFREIQLFIYFCHPTCLICGNNYCTCIANAKKNGSTSCDCPLGKYYWVYSSDPIHYNHQCLRCPSPCDNCTSPTVCTTCILNLLLTPNGSCVLSCPSDTYKSLNNCLSCHSSCQTCSSGTQYDCFTCPSSKVLYEGQCLDVCPSQTFNASDSKTHIKCVDCDSTCLTCKGPYNTDCLSCFNSAFMSDSMCMSSCPAGTYKDTEKFQCLHCYPGCLACFGSNPNQCITCSNSFINDGTCVSTCPANKFPKFYSSSNSTVCESCGLFCAVCNGVSQCSQCVTGFYFNETHKICQVSQSLVAYLVEVSNPIKFYLVFSSNWSYIDENYLKFFSLGLINNTISLGFESEIMKSTIHKNTFLIRLSHNQAIRNFTKIYLTISINIDYSQTDYHYKLRPNSTLLSVLLNPAPLCSSSQYYDPSLEQTLRKPSISVKLSYTKQATILLLRFTDVETISDFVPDYSKVTISGFSSSEFNFTVDKTSKATDFQLSISPFKSIVLRPTLTYSLDLPDEIIILHDLMNTSAPSDSIKVYDYYILSAETQSQIESAKKTKESTEYASESTAAIGTFISGGNPLFIQGMMLSQIIYLIKFANIDFPPNLEVLFKANELPKLFFFHHFQMAEEDELVLPREFIKEELSPYFLNNTGEIICKNGVLLTIAFTLLLLSASLQKRKKTNPISKLIGLIRNVIVWELILFYYLETLLKFSFLLTVSLMYPGVHSSQGILNYSISTVFLFLCACFFFHIFLVIKRCQSMKKEDVVEKHKLSIFLRDGTTTRKNLDRKTRILDEKSLYELKSEKTVDIKPKSGLFMNKDDLTSKESPILSLTPLTPPDYESPTKGGPTSPKKPTKISFVQFEASEPLRGFIGKSKLEITGPGVKEPEGISLNTKHSIIPNTSVKFSTRHFMDKGSDEMGSPGIKEPETISPYKNHSILPNSPMKLSKVKESGLLEVNPFLTINTHSEVKSLGPESSPKFSQKTETHIWPKSILPDPSVGTSNLAKSIKMKNKGCLDRHPWKFLYQPEHNNPERYLKDHCFLHEEIKPEGFARFFVLLDYLRQSAICILIALMRSQPLAQLVLINLMSVSFIIFTAVLRPFVRTYQLIFCIINEIFTLAGMIGVLGLVILDVCESGNVELRLKLGWVVIYANLGLLYWIILSCLISLGIKSWEKIRIRKKVFVD